MGIEVASIDNVNLERFREVLSGNIIVTEQGVYTSAHNLVTTLIKNSIEGGAGNTLHLAESTRYPTATTSGVLPSAAGLVGHLDLVHPAQPSPKYWDLASFKVPSKFPGLAFEIDFFPELDELVIDVQKEEICVAEQGMEYAVRQVTEGFTSFLRLLRARSND